MNKRQRVRGNRAWPRFCRITFLHFLFALLWDLVYIRGSSIIKPVILLVTGHTSYGLGILDITHRTYLFIITNIWVFCSRFHLDNFCHVIYTTSGIVYVYRLSTTDVNIISCSSLWLPTWTENRCIESYDDLFNIKISQFVFYAVYMSLRQALVASIFFIIRGF
jgi:hypothetical protein